LYLKLSCLGIDEVSYLLIKWVHVVSATILFGTGIGSAFYLFMANRQGKIDEINFATRSVVLADNLFTTPAAIIQLLTGIILVLLGGYEFSELWIAGGLVLYVFVGLCWLPVVLIQIQMRRMARNALEAGKPLPERYWVLNRRWIMLGSLAFPAMLVVFYLMIFKIQF